MYQFHIKIEPLLRQTKAISVMNRITDFFVLRELMNEIRKIKQFKIITSYSRIKVISPIKVKQTLEIKALV